METMALFKAKLLNKVYKTGWMKCLFVAVVVLIIFLLLPRKGTDVKTRGSARDSWGSAHKVKVTQVVEDAHPTPGHARYSWGSVDKVQVHAEDSVAQGLKQRIRVLCLVMTLKENEESRALAVNQTWGRRCTKLLFVTSEMLEDLPSLVLRVEDGRNHLTAKTMAMFKYAFSHYLDQFDWFLKADDDTFFVMENLRYLLSLHDPSNKVYVGHHFKRYIDSGYMSGGAGYAINNAALRHFGEKSNLCVSDGWGEDIDFGRCMENIGIQCYQTKDILGRNSFHGLGFDEMMYWFDKVKLHAVQVKEPIHIGPSCCSQLSVSFHYLSPQQMYQFEFLLYRMAVYGRRTSDNMFKDFFPATTIPKGHYTEDPIPRFY
ncbi:glycoprotein-N-acetylgalactosamine 3-beta-galactosyltransferase 1-like isoform X1 [Haliotis rubra]|uniref:glycoprotein-N-acetylgalactosamine 3-beta-galactosyltransferase 1-like isoform X1 n=1 Tax=Haliotis rubra TaxID=36100 RepID=UPI001EE5A30D|nr:glycoprotein-N-acetylgalactosamine 3-beta-galactosyltransferase 1-like isoform X1 [Haliotis rubra]XP_046577084.1 glycoprotein-N-acetylgalactosamine 3-beta-galactosyltransferase 1-like isoform X1 [Haliotis rubra]